MRYQSRRSLKCDGDSGQRDVDVLIYSTTTVGPIKINIYIHEQLKYSNKIRQ